MSAIVSLLEAHGGVAGRDQLTRRVRSDSITRAVSAGRVVRLLPRVYALPARRYPFPIRCRAALLFGGADSVLSHTSALLQWPRLHLAPESEVHILIPRPQNRRSTGFVMVHRHRDRVIPPGLVLGRYGLRTMNPAAALIDAWATLPRHRRRAPVIDAVRLGLVEPADLECRLSGQPRLLGRAELRELIGLLRSGCESELEMLGFLRIFSDRRFPAATRQYPVLVGGRRCVLDLAWPQLLLAVELDGAAYHGSDEARERGVRRDAALARAGWLTVRLTYDRLVTDPAGVIEELLGIIQVRRLQLGGAA